MKHKRLFGIIVLAIFAFCISGCDFIQSKSKYQKIRGKHNAGMYRETIPILEDWIDKDPDSVESHLLLANAYLNTNSFGFAEKRFSSALILQNNNESGIKLTERGISEKYLNVLIRYLRTDKPRDQYLFDRMLEFADAKLLAIAETHLNVFCDEYMNEQGYARAHKGYEYLVKLNSSLKKEIGQKHLIFFNDVNNQKLKTRVIEDAINFSREDSVTKAYADHYYELSEKTKTTKEAIAKLKSANQFGGYKAELQAKQEQLKQEQFLVLVKKMKAKRSDVICITTTPQKKLKPDVSFTGSKRVSYLSLIDFNVSDGAGYTENWEKASSKIKRADLYCSGNTNLFFTSKKKFKIYIILDKI